jgi:hypothetical protein
MQRDCCSGCGHGVAPPVIQQPWQTCCNPAPTADAPACLLVRCAVCCPTHPTPTPTPTPPTCRSTRTRGSPARRRRPSGRRPSRCRGATAGAAWGACTGTRSSCWCTASRRCAPGRPPRPPLPLLPLLPVLLPGGLVHAAGAPAALQRACAPGERAKLAWMRPWLERCIPQAPSCLTPPSTRSLTHIPAPALSPPPLPGPPSTGHLGLWLPHQLRRPARGGGPPAALPGLRLPREVGGWEAGGGWLRPTGPGVCSPPSCCAPPAAKGGGRESCVWVCGCVGVWVCGCGCGCVGWGRGVGGGVVVGWVGGGQLFVSAGSRVHAQRPGAGSAPSRPSSFRLLGPPHTGTLGPPRRGRWWTSWQTTCWSCPPYQRWGRGRGGEGLRGPPRCCALSVHDRLIGRLGSAPGRPGG